MEYKKDGKTYSFALDLDRILEMEEKDENYSFLDEVSKLGEGKFRVTTLNNMCKFMGTTYKDYIKTGLTVDNLSDILIECIKEAGFFTETPESN